MDNAQKKNGIEVATEVKSSPFGQDYYHTVRLSYQDLMRSPSYCQQMVEAVFRSIVEKAAEIERLHAIAYPKIVTDANEILNDAIKVKPSSQGVIYEDDK